MPPGRWRQPRVIRQNFHRDPMATTPQANRNHDGLGIQGCLTLPMLLKSTEVLITLNRHGS